MCVTKEQYNLQDCPDMLLIFKMTYRRLHLPVNARVQNMFSHDVKHLSFRCQTSSFPAQMWSFTSRHCSKGRFFLINRKGSFCLSRNTPEEEEEQLCMAKQLSLGSIPSDNGRGGLTWGENMFCACAFMGRCNRRYSVLQINKLNILWNFNLHLNRLLDISF